MRLVAIPTEEMVSNKFRFWLVRFGRIALLPIADVAEPHRTICAATQYDPMRNLFRPPS